MNPEIAVESGWYAYAVVPYRELQSARFSEFNPDSPTPAVGEPFGAFVHYGVVS